MDRRPRDCDPFCRASAKRIAMTPAKKRNFSTFLCVEDDTSRNGYNAKTRDKMGPTSPQT